MPRPVRSKVSFGNVYCRVSDQVPEPRTTARSVSVLKTLSSTRHSPARFIKRIRASPASRSRGWPQQAAGGGSLSRRQWACFQGTLTPLSHATFEGRSASWDVKHNNDNPLCVTATDRTCKTEYRITTSRPAHLHRTSFPSDIHCHNRIQGTRISRRTCSGPLIWLGVPLCFEASLGTSSIANEWASVRPSLGHRAVAVLLTRPHSEGVAIGGANRRSASSGVAEGLVYTAKAKGGPPRLIGLP